MNSYGHLAQAHWAEWLPERYATIKNPGEFFTMLGTEIEMEISTRFQARLTLRPSDVSSAEQAGWEEMARLMVTNEVLDELAYLTPEPDLDEADLPTDPLSPGAIDFEATMESYRTSEEEELAEMDRLWKEGQASRP